MPDPSTVRRWANQLFCFWLVLAILLSKAVGPKIFGSSTILAWDWSALCRILPVEVNSS